MTLVDQQVVVLITGISAAGKSTVAELLARRFERGVHVRGDVFRRMVVRGRHDMTDPPTEEAERQLRTRYRLGATTADAYFDAGFSVVVQDVVLGPSLATYADMIRSRPLIVVVLAPRADVIAGREAGRSKVAYRDGRFGIAALDDGLRNGTPRIGLWLDNSDQTPEQTVDEIVARGLGEGRIP
jgi:cytidylate kinase